ncbi:hypothetical protein VE03_01729 [Pseudogymnoascus sp. 23342-1-I1]|nr:hypothetical protein VE03_01729 [Pseudogymnoascus sp. 23342-1-I1]
MYNHTHRTDTVSSALSRTSRRSDESYTSQLSALTAATSVCADDHPPLPSLTRQPQLRHISTRITSASTASFRSSSSSPRSSALYAEPEEYTYDDYSPTSAPSYALPAPPSTATPTTPHDFALYFPSHRRLTIAHDPSSPDMAQNLVITTTPDSAQKTPMQLFHLRMHDIPTRAFSLRRYCRDSGREVCHSVLRGGEGAGKKVKQVKHPKLQRSMSTALATVTRSGVKRADSWGAPSGHHHHNNSNKSSYPPPTPLLTIPTRRDSGYETYFDEESDFSTSDSEDEEEFAPIPVPATSAQKKGRTNTTHLEFSNYAHVDLTRRGSSSSKHWDFEYWGTPYSWKREGDSYHLVPSSSSSSSSGIVAGGGAVAHIVPDVLTTSQTREEAREGCWIPKCSFWISDPAILAGGGDVADVVVATGIMALVDDKARAEERAGKGGRRSIKVQIPMSPVTLDLEVVGAREMMRSVFRKGSRDERERPGTARRAGREESKLRFGRGVEAC